MPIFCNCADQMEAYKKAIELDLEAVYRELRSLGEMDKQLNQRISKVDDPKTWQDVATTMRMLIQEAFEKTTAAKEPAINQGHFDAQIRGVHHRLNETIAECEGKQFDAEKSFNRICHHMVDKINKRLDQIEQKITTLENNDSLKLYTRFKKRYDKFTSNQVVINESECTRLKEIEENLKLLIKYTNFDAITDEIKKKSQDEVDPTYGKIVDFTGEPKFAAPEKPKRGRPRKVKQ